MIDTIVQKMTRVLGDREQRWSGVQEDQRVGVMEIEMPAVGIARKHSSPWGT